MYILEVTSLVQYVSSRTWRSGGGIPRVGMRIYPARVRHKDRGAQGQVIEESAPARVNPQGQYP